MMRRSQVEILDCMSDSFLYNSKRKVSFLLVDGVPLLP